MNANRLILLALVAALAACATPRAAPPPAAVPILRPTPAPAPPPRADWRDLPQSAGDWRWSGGSGRSSATFGAVGAAQLTLTCDVAARIVTLTRAGAATGTVPLVITATSQRRVLSAAATAAGVAVAIPPRDGLLDAIAFSRGRFMVEAAGLPALLVPSWPEISRVIEDCRG